MYVLLDIKHMYILFEIHAHLSENIYRLNNLFKMYHSLQNEMRCSNSVMAGKR